jgi:hypothetical protein
MGCARGFMAAVDQLALLGRAVTFRKVLGTIDAILPYILMLMVASLKSKGIDLEMI